MATYDPVRSGVGKDSVAKFLTEELTDDLDQIPGVAAGSIRKLAAAGIETPTQLLGKLLMLRTPGSTTQSLCDAFYAYLKDIGALLGLCRGAGCLV